jgi:hypothetical protein
MRAFTAKVVAEQPHPPRDVPLIPVVGALLRDPVWALIAFSGIFWLAVLVYYLAVGELGESTVSALALGTLSVVGATAGLGVVAFAVVRLARLVRTGRSAHAVVVSVDAGPPPGGTPTLDALEHGVARGTRRVVDGARTFEEAFVTDAQWARAVRPGTRMRVLVHPTEERSFFDFAVEAEDARPVAPAGVDTPGAQSA